MEGKGAELVNAFDAAYTNDRIRMLKILFSRLPAAGQRPLALCIRYLELQHVLRLRSVSQPFAQGQPDASPSSGALFSDGLFSGDTSEALELLDELLPYAASAERARIEDLKNMLSGMEKMRETVEMMQMMKELFPEGFSGDGEAPADLLSGMAGMVGMDLSDFFDNVRKGD